MTEEALGYAVRCGSDRRRRAECVIDQAVFATLANAGVLKPAGEGCWTLARGAPSLDDTHGQTAPAQTLEGERLVAEADGSLVRRRANLGESPLGWLSRRKGADGKPLLTAFEAAAGERLREDFHRAGCPGRLTMDWDAGPRGSSPRGPGVDPHLKARAAKDRLQAALDAAGPGLRDILERVCLAEASLEAAERALGHPRRSGKALLKMGLQRVAAFYGLG